jgi:hypothetical protein
MTVPSRWQSFEDVLSKLPYRDFNHAGEPVGCIAEQLVANITHSRKEQTWPSQWPGDRRSGRVVTAVPGAKSMWFAQSKKMTTMRLLSDVSQFKPPGIA